MAETISELMGAKRRREEVSANDQGEMLRSHLETARATNAALEGSLAEYKARCQSLEQEVSNLTSQLLASAAEKTAFGEWLNKATAHSGELMARIHDLEAELTMLRDQKAQMDAGMAQHVATIQAGEDMLRSERAARQEADKRVTAMSAEIRKAMPMAHPKPPEYTLEVTSHDRDGRIKQIKLKPVSETK